MTVKESKKRRKEAEARLRPLLLKAMEMRDALVGRRVVGVAFNGEGEGSYSLVLDNQTEVTFSSCGDDATFTYMDVEKTA